MGDLVLVLDNEIMKGGVDKAAPIVLDIEDKISALAEDDTLENRLANTLRTMKSMIGEYSNYASAYHNKCPKTIEQKRKYEKYIDVISVITGKSIDNFLSPILATIWCAVCEPVHAGCGALPC
jgi:hypothetical protein